MTINKITLANSQDLSRDSSLIYRSPLLNYRHIAGIDNVTDLRYETDNELYLIDSSYNNILIGKYSSQSYDNNTNRVSITFVPDNTFTYQNLDPLPRVISPLINKSGLNNSILEYYYLYGNNKLSIVDSNGLLINSLDTSNNIVNVEQQEDGKWLIQQDDGNIIRTIGNGSITNTGHQILH